MEIEHTSATESPSPAWKPRRSPALTIVTDSELQTYRSCPQLHHFKYREKLRPIVEAKNLAVGSIFHAGMRDGLKTGWAPEVAKLPTDQRVRHQITAATSGIDSLVNEWAAKIVEHGKDVDFDRLADEVDQTATMVKWMLGHYFKQTSADLTNLVLVEVEAPFEVVMNDRRGRPVSHLRYTGVRDAVFYDPGYNQLVLAEHKTSGSDPRLIEKRVEMDTQTAGYLHAMREQQKAEHWSDPRNGWSIPSSAGIGRVMYNVLRKAMPKSPNVNKDGTVSVAQCTTTRELYQAALDEQVNARKIAVTPKQAEFLSAIGTGDKFFARVEWHRTDADIERWRSDTFVDAGRVREADRSPEKRTRNTGHCNMPWSLACTYRQICLDPDAPELRTPFRVIGDVHAEVRAAETEVAL